MQQRPPSLEANRGHRVYVVCALTIRQLVHSANPKLLKLFFFGPCFIRKTNIIESYDKPERHFKA